MDIIGLAAIWIGVIFCAIGVVGIMRFQNVYNRLHATGLISTVGLTAIMLGAAILLPSVTLKLLALFIFLIVATPVVTQGISLAAYRAPDTDAEPEETAKIKQ